MEKSYYYTEELANVLSHGIGLLLSIAALFLLLERSLELGDAVHIVSFSIFGVSLIFLYGTSTIYHNCAEPVLRARLRVLDHVSIYVLIAGTYTPFTLITLKGGIGWVIFSISWGMAITGTILKLFYTGRYTKTSTLMYVAMGWVIVFAIKPLVDELPEMGLLWLIAGGVAYTIGAVLYSVTRIPFNHAIFHILVMVGSGCHFVVVYLYVS